MTHLGYDELEETITNLLKTGDVLSASAIAAEINKRNGGRLSASAIRGALNHMIMMGIIRATENRNIVQYYMPKEA